MSHPTLRSRSKALAAVAVVMIGGTLAGCAGDDDKGTGGIESNVTDPNKPGAAPAAAAASSSLSATIITKELRSDAPNCSVHLDRPGVDTKNPAVDEAIAKALAVPTLAQLCGGLEKDESLSTEGAFGVDTNRNGVLSLSIGESSFMAGASSIANSLVGHTFDLNTGKKLKLTDVLQPAGIEKVKAACVKEIDEERCGFALDEKDGAANFTMQEDGLMLVIKVPEEVLVPWSELASSVTPGLIANWLAAAPKK